MPIKGKQIKDSSILLNKINPQANQLLTLLGNSKIQQNQIPTTGIDLANKDYVDAVAQGLSGKAACRTATTTNISIVSAPSSIGGVTLSIGDRILVKDQSSGFEQENGLYEFNGTGNPLTRTTDANDNTNPSGASEIKAGLFTFVTEGTFADTGWLLATNNPIIIDTTPLLFIQFSSAGIITASNGLTKTINDILLGGPLSQNTSITGSYSFTFDVDSLQYLNDQHLTYTNRSLVDKEYVDNEINLIDTRVTNLETVVFYTNQLISGGASFISGLTFAVTNLLYIINGQVYTSLATNVTIGAGDVTYDRIDIIVVDINGVVSVIPGTPAVNPIKPDIDETTQVEVTFITVPQGAVTLPIPITIVYNENLGPAAEWSASTNFPSNINVNSSTGTPYSGTKSIELTNVPTAKTIVLSTATPFDTTTQNTLQFAIKNKIAWTTTRRLRITLQSAAGVQLGNIVDLYQGLYGFSSANTSIWQIITIPISKFAAPSALISKIVITTYSTSGTLNLYLDYIRLIVGSPTTTTQNTFLSIQDDASGITTATSPTDILSILGGTNITSVVGTKTLTLNLDPSIAVTSITASTFGLSSSTANTLAYFDATKHLTSVILGSGLTFSGGTLSTVSNLSGTTNYVAKFINPTTVGNGIIYDDGTNIGIGITASLAKLHVNTNGFPNNVLFSSDNSSSSLTLNTGSSGFIGSGGSGIYLQTVGSTKGSFYSNTSVGATFLTSEAGYSLVLSNASAQAITLGVSGNNIEFITGGVNKMIIDGVTSNVGIGTLSPLSKLYVNSSIQNEQITLNNDDITGSSYFSLAQSGGTKAGMILLNSNHPFIPKTLIVRNLWDNGGIRINGASDANIMYFDTSTFNVGIGTVVPSSLLHIVGTNSSVGYSLKVQNSTLTPLFYVRNDGYVTIGGTTLGAAKLEITGGSDQGIYAVSSNNIAVNGVGNGGAGFGVKGQTDFGTALRANVTDNGGVALELVNTAIPLSPIDLFKVLADGRVFALPTYNDLVSVGTASFLGIDSTGKLYNTNASPASLGNVFATGSVNYTPRWISSTTLSGTSSIYDDGTNIGIGTQSDVLHRVNIQGDVNIEGTLYATSKSFEIKHPLDPTKRLVYGSLEGPEYGIYVRGKLENNNVIELPDYWTKLANHDTITVDLTPFGSYQKIYVKEVKNNKIYIGNKSIFKSTVNCYYTVYAERNDIPKIKLEK